MNVAYFINQYPKVSHSFIRREILALERLGIKISRYALRGWDGHLVDEEDINERKLTRYVLGHGPLRLFLAVARVLLGSPLRFLISLKLALRVGMDAERPLPYHLVYLFEACQLLHWVRQRRVSHIHGHFGSNSAEVLMLLHSLGGPNYSFTVHGPEEFDAPRSHHLAEKIYHAAFVVAISSYGRSQLYRWVSHDHWRKIKIVHCGIEPLFYEGGAKCLPDNRRLVCVGRLCAQKGQLLLVEAAHRLAARGVEFELVLAGDGEMRAELEGLIQCYGLNSRVSITGWIDSGRVRKELLAARGLVLPSFAEGLPVVLMEAMALRRPVLTTYVAGIPELVIDGENGWLVPAGDLDALTMAMERFLTLPEERIASMGEAGYRRVQARHDIDTEVSRLAGYFREYVDDGR